MEIFFAAAAVASGTFPVPGYRTPVDPVNEVSSNDLTEAWMRPMNRIHIEKDAVAHVNITVLAFDLELAKQ